MACPICRTARPEVFFQKGGMPLLICRACRHVYWQSMPTEADLIQFYASEYTDEHGQRPVQERLNPYYFEHAKSLARVVGAAERSLAIVDVGCSYPVFLAQAKLAGYARVLGVDPSASAAAYGRRVGVDVVPPEGLEDIPDQAFDILRYSHTLEHMIDPAQTLRAQIAKLRRGGILHITQPNFPTFRAGYGQDLKDAIWPTHLHFFNPVSLKIMVENAGGRVIRMFSVEGGEAARDRYGLILDTEHSRNQCSELAALSEPTRGEANNFPLYAGENSFLLAVRAT